MQNERPLPFESTTGRRRAQIPRKIKLLRRSGNPGTAVAPKYRNRELHR
jgi:hypothetical protein